jgi:hypothetical protein
MLDMGSVLTDLVASPWVTHAVTLVIGIASAAVTIRYGMLRRLKYRCKSFRLIVDSTTKLPELEVRYPGFGQPVENVTVSKVALWNAGRGTIKKGDVLGKDNLRITIDQKYVILSAGIVQQENHLNAFEVTKSQDRKSVTVGFDFMNPSEGAVFQVVHTGTKSRDLTMSGTIADAASPMRTYGGPVDQGGPVNITIISGISMLAGVLITIGAVYIFTHMIIWHNPHILRLPWFLSLGVGSAVVAGPLLYIHFLDRIASRVSSVPKGLNKYDQDF